MQDILFNVEDTLTRYAGKNLNYKIFNEPSHGASYRSVYNNVWDRVIAKARESDPAALRSS